MSITRQKEFPELVANRTPSLARGDLQVYSSTQVDNLISALDLSPYALNSTVSNISASLDTRIDTLETNTALISSNLTTDINNVDLSLTAKIAQDCVQSAGVTGASGSVIGYLTITINGVEYKLATVA